MLFSSRDKPLHNEKEKFTECRDFTIGRDFDEV